MTAPGREERDALLARIAKKRYETPAWQRKEGQNPKGGLNAKGRASYARETGGKLRPPVKSGDNPRRASFLARMGNMPGPERDENGEPTRLLLSLQAWGASSKADARAKAKRISARLQAKKSAEDIEKGEGPGHPFRGNQYVRGNTGAISATAGRELKTGGGFTIDPRKPTKILRMGESDGFVVATHPQANRQIPSTQLRTQAQRREAIGQYIKDNEATLAANKYLHVGGWLDKESGTVHLDLVSVMPSRAQAVAVGKQHGELAIFDLKSGEEIFIKEYRYGRTEAGSDGPPRGSDDRSGHRRVLPDDRTGPSRGRVNKGEGPGHPFRGNQYKKIGGGLSISNANYQPSPKTFLGDEKDLRRFAKGNSKDVPLIHLGRVSSVNSADGIAQQGISADLNGANGAAVYLTVGDHGVNYWKARYRYRGNPEIAVFDVSVRNIKNVYIREKDAKLPSSYTWQKDHDALWDIASGAFIVKDPKNVMVSRTYRTVSSADQPGLTPITKGEGPGHPFRGNQYVRGRSGGFSLSASTSADQTRGELSARENDPRTGVQYIAGLSRVQAIHRGDLPDDPRTVAAAQRIERAFPNATVTIAGMDPDYAEHLARVAETHAQRYPALEHTVSRITLDYEGQMGRLTSGGSQMDFRRDGKPFIELRFNIAYGADPAHIAMLDKSGYHTGWHPGKNPSFTFDHEFGHAVDYTAGIQHGIVGQIFAAHMAGDQNKVANLMRSFSTKEHLGVTQEQTGKFRAFDFAAAKAHEEISTGWTSGLYSPSVPRNMRRVDVARGAGWGYGVDHFQRTGGDMAEYIADAHAFRMDGGTVPRPLAPFMRAIDRLVGATNVQKETGSQQRGMPDPKDVAFSMDMCAGYTPVDPELLPFLDIEEIAKLEETEKAFRSKSQWRWAFATGQPWARRWAHETPGNPGGRFRRLPRYVKTSRSKANLAQRKVKKADESSITIPVMQAEVVFDMTLKGEGPGHPFRGNQHVKVGSGVGSVPGYVGTYGTTGGTAIVTVDSVSQIDAATKAWSTGNAPELDAEGNFFKIVNVGNDDAVIAGLHSSSGGLGSGVFLAASSSVGYWEDKFSHDRGNDDGPSYPTMTYRVALRNMKNVRVIDESEASDHDSMVRVMNTFSWDGRGGHGNGKPLPPGEEWDAIIRRGDGTIIVNPKRMSDVAVVTTDRQRNFMFSGHPMPAFGSFSDEYTLGRSTRVQWSESRANFLAGKGIQPKSPVTPFDRRGNPEGLVDGKVYTYRYPSSFPKVGANPGGPPVEREAPDYSAAQRIVAGVLGGVRSHGGARPTISDEKIIAIRTAEREALVSSGRSGDLGKRGFDPYGQQEYWNPQAHLPYIVNPKLTADQLREDRERYSRDMKNIPPRMNLYKGEGPGHPFRGNQFVRGRSGGVGGGGNPDVAGSGPPGAVYVEHPQAAMALIRQGKSVVMPHSALEGTFLAMHDDVERATKAGETPTVYNLKHVSIAGVPYAKQPWSNPANHRDLTRAEMPQVPRKNGVKTMFIKTLRKSGVKVKEKNVDALSLKGIQREVNGANAGRIIRAYKGGELDTDRIPVSREGHILDGHHRWAASIAMGRPVSVFRVDLSTDKLITSARKMNKKMGVRARGIEELGPTTKARFEAFRSRLGTLRRSNP